MLRQQDNREIRAHFFKKSSESPWEQSMPLSLLILSLILCVRVYAQTYGRQNSTGSKALISHSSVLMIVYQLIIQTL